MSAENRFAFGEFTVLSQCAYCVHLHDGDVAACDAFPDGIPDAILTNEIDHRQPVEGDHDIRFEAEDVTPKETLERLFEVLDATVRS